jgi:hypothetical protein
MKLEDKINDRKIAYVFRKAPAIAFETGLLYFILAKRRVAGEKVKDACQRSLYWLKQAGIDIPAAIVKLSSGGQLREIEAILVSNKGLIGPEYMKEPYMLNLSPANVDATISLA